MDTLGVIATVIVVIATAVATQIGESIRQWLIENMVDPFGQFLIEKLVKPVGQWLGYSFHYSTNIDNMKKQAEKLGELRERVKHSVDAGIGNCSENKADVNRCLENVDVIMGKVRKVLEDEAKAKMKCSYGICLNLKLRHELSKKAKKIAKDIDEVLENGGFDKVSNMDYMSFNSRMSTLNGLTVALGDVNINMIGVWGMPGAGKTTLVRKVVWQAKKEKLFDEVAMATVTQSPDLRQIQGEIADMLDLKFDDVETVPGRATRLRERLERNKKVLVILDDIWNKLDLEAIGIPCNGCKILLTSRDRDILSCEMNTQKNFELDVLFPDEAWSLFEKMAGDCLKDPNLRSIATQVAEVCAGLPLAIVTVATALKNKSLFEWEDALQQLRRPSPVHLTGMQAAIYSKIELSYKHLGSPVLKSFFLLCSQMGPTIVYLDLVKYCFGLCLFPGIRTLEEARNKVYTLVRSLKDSCLLLEDPRTSKYVRMHDLVRDVARLIAKAENEFSMSNDDPVKWLDEDALTKCTSISVHARDIHELPGDLVCPKLKLLYVHGGDRDFKISETFFKGMRELKVLDLTKMRLSSLPSSINLLTNLRTLCLDGCVLKDITLIGELKNLEILSLLYSKFTQLPKEIGLLTRLRLLDLSNCTKLEVIPPNVLSRLVQLEELYVRNSFTQWELEGVNNERASLAELKHLSLLTTLEVNIPDANLLPKNLLFKKLKRYKIFIGDVWDQFDKPESSRALKLKLNSSFELERGIKMLLSGIEDLCLDELKGVKSIISELDSKGFQQLKHLRVQNNYEMKYIIYSKGLAIADVVFPVLEILSLKNMINLEEICHGQIPSASFRNLSIMKVEHCEKLKFIFSSTIAKGLPQLQKLVIQECSIMGAIIIKEEGEIEDRDMILFPRLRHLELHQLPKLVSFLNTQKSVINDAGEIIPECELDFHMPILQEQVVFPNLESLKLSSIQSEEIPHNQHRASSSFKLTNIQTDSRFQNLCALTVKGSGNLKYLLSSSTAKSMVQLQYLIIDDCKVMEEILLTEDLGEEQIIPKVLFPRLEGLILKDLPVLKRFCVGSNIKFPSLKSMLIDQCPKLESFIFKPVSSKEMNSREISHTAVQPLFNEKVALPNLVSLIISHMPNLKIIWHDKFAPGSFTKLQFMMVQFCESLMNIFQVNMLSRFQSMESLVVDDCDSLEEIFELQGQEVTETHAVTVTQLKKLFIHRLPQLKRVWNKDPQGMFSFPNLQEIVAGECESLKSLFPTTVAKCLPQLEDLQIVECGIEEIIEQEEGAKEDARFVFPKLSLLILQKLSKLKWFYRGVHTSKWPLLKTLKVFGSNEIQIFAPKNYRIQEQDEQIQLEASIQQPLFLVEEAAFPSLENLCLDQFVLEDMAMIGELKNLEILSLRGSNVEQLPTETGLLTRLRILNLSNCTKLKVIPPNVLSCLIQLEELYVGNSFTQWEVEGLNNERASLAELKHLSRLTTLEVHIPDANMLPKDLLFEKLQRYKIFVGDVWDWSDKHENPRALKLKLNTRFHLERGIKMLLNGIENLCLDELKGVKSVIYDKHENSRALKLKLNSSFELERGIKMLLRGIEDLCLDELKGVKSIISELDSKGFQQLKHLRVQNNYEMKYIIYSKGLAIADVVFPVLEILSLKNMINLEEICHGQIPSASFRNLSIMKVKHCEKLKFIFSSTIAKGLPQLQKLVIRECSIMGAIIIKEEGEIEDRDTLLFPQLRHLELHQLPKLVSFLNTQKSVINDAGEIIPECEMDFHMPILQEQVVFPNLETLQLSSIDSEEILQQNQHRASSSFKLTNIQTDSRFQNLCSLSMKGSGNLKYLLSSSTATFMVQLKGLIIEDCKVMEEILLLTEDLGKEEMFPKVLFPRLEGLVLKDLPVLKRFCVGRNIIFLSLKVMVIEKCPKLESFISKPISSEAISHTAMQPLFNEEVAFPSLENLAIVHIKNLKIIWNKDPQGMFSLQNLQEIVVRECESLKSLFPTSVAKCLQQLETLQIIECGIEEIIEQEEGAKEDARFVFPKLTLLILRKLSKLKWFYRGVHTLEWPLLKTLEVSGSNEIQIFASKNYRIQEQDEQSQLETSLQQPLFLVEEVLLPSLETLELSFVHSEEIILHNQHWPTSSFKSTNIQTESRFQNLRNLKVKGSGNLKYLFSSSTATYMVQLKDLFIEDCKVMEEILLHTKDLGEEEIIPKVLFPRLESLVLIDLPVLKRFCVGRNIIFRSLKGMVIAKCPKLESFIFNPVSSAEISHTAMQHLFDEEVAFPSLETLAIVYMKNLKIIWNKDPQGTFSFQNLQRILVMQCESLKSFFPISVARCLQQLEELRIFECGIEEIIEQKEGAKEHPRFVFPKLTLLILRQLPKLKWFYRGVHTSDWPLLKTLEVFGSNEIQIFASENYKIEEPNEQSRLETCIQQPLFLVEEVAFPNLESLTISHLPNLKIIWHDKFAPGSFMKLQTLKVELCENLMKIFQVNMLSGFHSLDFLIVDGCGSLQEIFEPQGQEVMETHAVTVTQLKKLFIRRLPKLKHVWNKDPQRTFSFPNLQEIVVGECESLKSLFPTSVARCLQQLNDLRIFECGIEEIIEQEEGAKEDVRFVFPKLTLLILRKLSKIKWFYRGVHTSEWPLLESLEVSGSNEIQIFASKNYRIQEQDDQSQLETSIQQPLFLVEEVAFPSLKTLRLDQCVLEDIAMIGKLRNLEILSLLHSNVEQLPTETGLLTRLRILNLSNCTKLKVIPPNVLSCLIELEELYVGNSFTQWNVEGLNNERASLAELKHLSRSTTLEVHIPDANMLPKDLLFEKLQRYKIFVGDVWDWSDKQENSRALKLKLNTSFHLERGIKMLLNGIENLWLDELKGVKSVIFELDMTGFQQLKHLHVQNNVEIKYIINSRGMVISDAVFPVLEMLSLKNMINLEEICHGQIPSASFRNLSIIKVLICDKLKNLVPSSVSFQNLTNLEICKCHGLINLVTSSTAKSLVQLKKMSVSECERITEVVTGEGGEASEVITFTQLTYLKLDCLPNLSSFCSISYCFEFPSLEEVIVRQCPEMKTFSHGALGTPKLERVQATQEDEWHWKANLNATIHWLWKSKYNTTTQ